MLHRVGLTWTSANPEPSLFDNDDLSQVNNNKPKTLAKTDTILDKHNNQNQLTLSFGHLWKISIRLIKIKYVDFSQYFWWGAFFVVYYLQTVS